MDMTTYTAADLADARQRNEAIWKQTSSLYYLKRIDESLALWHEDARYEAAFPVPGLPAVVEGRAALVAMFAGMAALAQTITVHDVRFEQTDDPDVVYIDERMVADLVGGGRYENRNLIRLTFRDGLIAEMLEFSGQRALEGLLQRIA